FHTLHLQIFFPAAVGTDGPDIQVDAVIQDHDPCVIEGLPALIGIADHKGAGRPATRPVGLVQLSVHDDPLAYGLRPDPWFHRIGQWGEYYLGRTPAGPKDEDRAY